MPMGISADLLQLVAMDTFKLGQPAPPETTRCAVPSRASPPPLLTPQEHDGYLEELSRLREIRNREIPELLRAARAFVANAAAEEVIQIQEDQAVIDARMGRLEDLLATAQIVDAYAAPQVVTLGRTVEVEYVRTAKVASYLIAGVPRSPAGSGTVSAASPIGAALMGRSAGDIVTVELPRGRVEELRILSVLREERAA